MAIAPEVRPVVPEVMSNTRLLTAVNRLPGVRLLLPLLSIALISAVACGTDGGNSEPAAAEFQIQGDTLTWAPPWHSGDSRTVTAESSTEFSPALQEQFDAMQMLGGTGADLLNQPATVIGTISVLSADSGGAKAEFDIALQELIEQAMDSDLMSEPGLADSDFEQFTAVMGLLDQLDLGVKFGIDSTGALTGVTNMDELATTVREFIDSVLTLATFAGESPLEPEDREKLNNVLAALPDTETARFASDAALNVGTANLFLMRSGVYAVGQPVAIAGNVPTAYGFETEGHATYELTDISNGAATMRIEVSPGEVDVLAMVQQYAVEIASLIGEDASELTDSIADLEPDERSLATALTGILFDPYTVMLTIDTTTGWVTTAEWSIVLALPEGFEDLIPEEDRDFDGFDLSDFVVTLHMRATFD